MALYEHFDQIGQNNITSTRSDLINSVGTDGMKDIIRKVLLGGNVRDITEFITQRRLLNTYAATLKLFITHLAEITDSIADYSDVVTDDLSEASGNAKVLDLWLLGLTKKGLDNIVRTEENILEYRESFASSTEEAIEDLKNDFGIVSGQIQLGDKEIEVNWNLLTLMFMALGSQTLSIRGSAKSMNGKLFEKLVLGTLLTIMDFTFYPAPPRTINETDRIFWLSNMDENERETDAMIVYNGTAISIDIGFIGKGNPEITLDKVTRFGAYKHIGGIKHDMQTIIIVDTVADNSDLFNKAERVRGHVLQMKIKTWIIEFSNLIHDILGIDHDICHLKYEQLDDYLAHRMQTIDIERYL